MKMEIEDRCHRESTLVVTITTPKDGMMYDDEVVQRSVKHLVDELSKNAHRPASPTLWKKRCERDMILCVG
jgi:hypothetical protein